MSLAFGDFSYLWFVAHKDGFDDAVFLGYERRVEYGLVVGCYNDKLFSGGLSFYVCVKIRKFYYPIHCFTFITIVV